MADTHSRTDLTETDPPERPDPGPPIRRRRGLRIVLLSLASVVVLLGMVVAGGYAYVNHEVGSIHRVPVTFVALHLPAGTSTGMTILLTARPISPAGTSGGAQTPGASGLIMLLHVNSNDKAGGVVSIPPQTEVAVPAHGQMQLEQALATGGPSLLVKAVQSLTGVQITHYAAIDFNHEAAMVNALGGVTVTLPETTTSGGYTFKKGANHLNGVAALAYARQTSLTEQGRVLRQQSLTRAVLNKLSGDHLLTNPLTMVHVLKAITSMLTVDSNFSNSQIASLATKLAGVAGSATYVTAPVQTTDGKQYPAPQSTRLWSAINHDSIASFAKQHPATVTPGAPK